MARVRMVKWTPNVDWGEVLGARRCERPGLHFHGYRWAGRGHETMSFKHQHLRVPGNPGFMGSTLPPDATCHNLLRPRTLVVGTWDAPQDAAAWIRREFDAVDPRDYPHDPDNSEQYHRVTLMHGKDTVWRFGNPEYASREEVHLVVVCCPNEVPGLPCPLRR